MFSVLSKVSHLVNPVSVSESRYLGPTLDDGHLARVLVSFIIGHRTERCQHQSSQRFRVVLAPLGQ